jgi:2-hydroxychromene-2-carboxylate isomerase
MTKHIDFYWDPASTYSYLAATRISALAERNGATVAWKPFLLGKVFEATGNRMPASVPAKAKYLFKDVSLWAKFYQVPFRMPKVFPLHSVAPARAAIAAEQAGHGQKLTMALLHAYWAEGKDISQPALIAETITACGLPADSILAACQEPAVKDVLRANTEAAIALGVFGAPTFFVDGQMFWGNDRMDLMEAYLQGKL